MNVLLVHSGKWEYRTGVITHICCLGRALGGRGHSVKTIMLGKKKEFAQAGVHYLFSPDLFHFILDVHRQARQSDVVHCHDALSVLPSLPKGKCALIYTSHHVFADTRYLRSCQEWRGAAALGLRTRLKCFTARMLGHAVLERVDRVIAVSAFTKGAVSQTYQVPTSRIEVVFNGIEVGDFAGGEITSSEEGVSRILFVKPSEPRKGLHHLLEALPLVLEEVPEAELVVAGAKPSGNYGEYIQNLLDKYHISAKVVLTGEVSFDDLVSLYLSSHVVVMPSSYEGFGIVVLEAGICGKPVIASNIGGLDEAVVDGETGFLVDVKDASVLARTIIRVLLSSRLQRQLGENARRRILENFTWDRIGAKTESIYKAVLAGSSATVSA